MTIHVMTSPDWKLEIDDPDVELTTWDFESPAPDVPVDLLVAPHVTSPDIIDRVSGLGAKVLQLGSIGYDAVSRDLPEGLIVANAASVHETATAEHALAMLLYAAREFNRSVEAQRREVWEEFQTVGLADTTVLLVGVGGVGSAIADRLDPFEISLIRVGSRARDDERGHVHETGELPELLPQADAVIVVVPHTENTHHLIDEDFLSAMKDNAILLNIARGKVADTEALVRHAGRLRLLLDVVDPEPLPEGHELFTSALLITAHNGGNADAMLGRMKNVVLRQIDAMKKGEPPINQVLPA